jgi:hypothetical protein
MIGHVPTPLDLEDLYSTDNQLSRRQWKAVRPGAPAESNDRIMLDQ